MSWRPKLRTEYHRPGHKLAWDVGYADGRARRDRQPELAHWRPHRQQAYRAGYEHGRTERGPR